MRTTIYLLAVVMLPSAAQAFEVSKDEWIDTMSTALPTAFCTSSSYFRQCYDISAEDCETTALSATRICLTENSPDIPEILKQPEEGKHWGTIIGSCAGKGFELSLADKRIDNFRCNNIGDWK